MSSPFRLLRSPGAFWKSLSTKLRLANEHLVRFFSEASTSPDEIFKRLGGS